MCKSCGKAVYSRCVNIAQAGELSAENNQTLGLGGKTGGLYIVLHTFCTRVLNTLFSFFQSVTLSLYPSSTGLITITTIKLISNKEY